MSSVSLYILGSVLLFFSGLLVFMFGVYFLVCDYTVFLEWEILSLNSCSVMMTFLFDWISLIFLGCVFVISSMVIYYSESYMYNDLYKVRFYFLVLMFVLSMMMMIVSPNLMSILIGWDGLGLVSYCLVIYFQNFKSYSAGMLTILANRIGDVAILLAIAWMMNFGSWHFIFYMNLWDDKWMGYLVLLIILAGFTKSAQIPFSSWLPAAMAAPTPVSALVHSSTLVTAGVYLLIRFSNLLLNIDCSFFLLLSVMTMFMAGLGANFEYDLKKIIALSTLSQLGLMMSILFIGYPILAFFHLLTHAFFKALLFLCAGLMIHCMNDSQDIRHMGAMVNYLPFTCSCFCISNLSLCGLPFMSGFYSKDVILEMMSYSYFNLFIFFIFFVSVGLTASYSMRLVYFCISFNMNSFVCQNYYEEDIMMKSMVLLSLLAIMGGSCLSWLIFNCPSLILFPLYLKLLPIIFVLLGGWLGYEFSYVGYYSSLFFLRFNSFSFYSGCMWFMPMFSTYMLYNGFISLSSGYDETLEGWGEYSLSGGLGNFFSELSVYLTKHQSSTIMINISVFMMSFIFLFLISLL